MRNANLRLSKSIVIRNGKIVAKVISAWTWVPKGTSTQATSEYMKCKHWMCQKMKTTIYPYVLASWCNDISFCYCSNINPFLTDYAWCNICLPFFQNSSRKIIIQKKYWRNNLRQSLVVITRDRMIDDILKGKIKTKHCILVDYS